MKLGGAIFAALMTLALSGCGVDPREWVKVSEDKDSKKKHDSQALVVGYWTGIFEERGTDGKLKDPVPVEIELTGASAFRLVFPDTPNVFVSGDFREFETRRSLLFTIRQSTFSLVGSPGRLVNVTYRVAGDEMTLSGGGGEYTVSRATKPGDPSNPDAATADGAWRCRDRSGNAWRLSIDLDRARFEAWIYSSGRPLRVSGVVTLRMDAWRLTVRSSNNADLVGATLDATSPSAGRLMVDPAPDASGRTFECRRP